jgi:hypothetical protein
VAPKNGQQTATFYPLGSFVVVRGVAPGRGGGDGSALALAEAVGEMGAVHALRTGGNDGGRNLGRLRFPHSGNPSNCRLIQ